MNTGLKSASIYNALSLFIAMLLQHIRDFLTLFCLAHHHAEQQSLKSAHDDCNYKYADAVEDATSFQEVKSRKQKKKDKKASSKRNENERFKVSQCDDSSEDRIGILPAPTTCEYEKKHRFVHRFFAVSRPFLKYLYQQCGHIERTPDLCVSSI
jgi:hypothetical protein